MCLCATPWVDGWLRTTPSMAMDSLPQNGALQDAARLRLDIPILDGGGYVIYTYIYIRTMIVDIIV